CIVTGTATLDRYSGNQVRWNQRERRTRSVTPPPCGEGRREAPGWGSCGDPLTAPHPQPLPTRGRGGYRMRGVFIEGQIKCAAPPTSPSGGATPFSCAGGSPTSSAPPNRVPLSAATAATWSEARGDRTCVARVR